MLELEIYENGNADCGETEGRSLFQMNEKTPTVADMDLSEYETIFYTQTVAERSTVVKKKQYGANYNGSYMIVCVPPLLSYVQVKFT